MSDGAGKGNRIEQGGTGWTGTDPLSFIQFSSIVMTMTCRRRGLVIERAKPGAGDQVEGAEREV